MYCSVRNLIDLMINYKKWIMQMRKVKSAPHLPQQLFVSSYILYNILIYILLLLLPIYIVRIITII